MPNEPEILDTYAYVLEKNEQYLKAEQFLQMSMHQFEVRRKRITWQMYERLGDIKEKLGANIQALAAFKQALEVGIEEIPEEDNLRITEKIERLSQ